MRSEIKLWSVQGGKLSQLTKTSFSQSYKEKDLENWVEQDPSLLGRDLTIVGRQVYIPGVGPLDLLAVDESGRLFVIEFKRQQTTRETIAQILDYASSIRLIDKDQLRNLPNVKTAELEEIKELDPGMILVAEEADEAVQRIVEYLASKAQLPIEIVTFTYAVSSNGPEVIARSVLVPETPPQKEQMSAKSLPQLLQVASDRKVVAFVNILRKVISLGWYEEILDNNGGTARYWITIASPLDDKYKVLFGINIGGTKWTSPEGTLDVWIRQKIASSYSQTTIQDVSTLLHEFNPFNETEGTIWFRILDETGATRLLTILDSWHLKSTEIAE